MLRDNLLKYLDLTVNLALHLKNTMDCYNGSDMFSSHYNIDLSNSFNNALNIEWISKSQNCKSEQNME